MLAPTKKKKYSLGKLQVSEMKLAAIRLLSSAKRLSAHNVHSKRLVRTTKHSHTHRRAEGGYSTQEKRCLFLLKAKESAVSTVHCEVLYLHTKKQAKQSVWPAEESIKKKSILRLKLPKSSSVTILAEHSPEAHVSNCTNSAALSFNVARLQLHRAHPGSCTSIRGVSFFFSCQFTFTKQELKNTL